MTAENDFWPCRNTYPAQIAEPFNIVEFFFFCINITAHQHGTTRHARADIASATFDLILYHIVTHIFTSTRATPPTATRNYDS